MSSVPQPPGEAIRNVGIDAGRTAAFVGVVLIHAYDMGGPAAFWGAAGGRFAVPMFFVVSGYFLNTADPWLTSVKRYSIRLLPVFLFWAIVYLVVYAAWPTNARDWALLLIKGGKGNHLWFIPSLWLCLIVELALVRSFGLAVASIVALALYAFGLAIGSYSSLAGLEQSYWNPRDGLMFGLLLVVLGSLLRQYPIAIRLSQALFLFILFSAVHLLEFYLISQYHPEYTDFFITTPALAVSAFWVASSWQPTHRWSVGMATLGRFSLGFYAIHMFFINLCKEQLPHGLTGWGICVIFVVLSSVAVTLLMARFEPLQRFLR